MKYTIFWFRRDLRLEDNTGLNEALRSNTNVLPVFIFDDNILGELPKDDPRVYFIYESLQKIDKKLKDNSSSLLCLKGKPIDIWKKLIHDYSIDSVYVNKDYEPYSLQRDLQVSKLLNDNGINFKSYKDQVIFEELEIVKGDGTPYTVYTPYKNKWLSCYSPPVINTIVDFNGFHRNIYPFPLLEELGFKSPKIRVKEADLSKADDYAENRDYPSREWSSYLGPHLRFGTVSIRQVISKLEPCHTVFLNELIWREFFMQILSSFPHVVDQNFRSKYDGIQWLNNENDFQKWCSGQTGYPLVDAGMRQLNKTGYMHNRVRMVCAGFLCKHLLIDWRWGEAYFANKLLDYELSSNNGNWQWAAGTGCDAAPYFRIFNPEEQFRKFDKENGYVKKWIPEYKTNLYPKPIVEHKLARMRALETYRNGIKE